jgi:FixJ family two-component response regulator
MKAQAPSLRSSSFCNPRPRSARRRRTVLVIQTSTTVCDLLASLLRHQGFDTVAATTLEQGLERSAQRALDLVIADYRAPGEADARYLQVLRCQDRALSDEFELIAKPFSVESLLDAVNRLSASARRIGAAPAEVGAARDGAYRSDTGQSAQLLEVTLSLPLAG